MGLRRGTSSSRPPSAAPDLAAIDPALRASLARFKQPKALEVMADLPRNAMGKVQKAGLRKRLAARFGQAGHAPLPRGLPVSVRPGFDDPELTIGVDNKVHDLSAPVQADALKGQNGPAARSQ